MAFIFWGGERETPSRNHSQALSLSLSFFLFPEQIADVSHTNLPRVNRSLGHLRLFPTIYYFLLAWLQSPPYIRGFPPSLPGALIQRRVPVLPGPSLCRIERGDVTSRRERLHLPPRRRCTSLRAPAGTASRCHGRRSSGARERWGGGRARALQEEEEEAFVRGDR